MLIQFHLQFLFYILFLFTIQTLWPHVFQKRLYLFLYFALIFAGNCSFCFASFSFLLSNFSKCSFASLTDFSISFCYFSYCFFLSLKPQLLLFLFFSYSFSFLFNSFSLIFSFFSFSFNPLFLKNIYKYIKN